MGQPLLYSSLVESSYRSEKQSSKGLDDVLRILQYVVEPGLLGPRPGFFLILRKEETDGMVG